MNKLYCAVCCALLFGWSAAIAAEPLRITLDPYPPFEYAENGEAKGIGSEVVKAALQEAELEATFTEYPFVRAYNMLKANQEAIFYYSLARTPERESLFQWIGVVASATHGLLALKDKAVTIEKLEDLKHYTIGSTNEDVVDQYLLARKEQLGLQLDRHASYETNIKKLFGKRVDVWAGNHYAGLYLAEKLGHRADDLKIVYTFDELQADYYLAASLSTPAETIEKLRAAFEKIHSDGTYDNIVNAYFEKK